MKIRQIVVGIVTLLTVLTAFAVIPTAAVKAAPAAPQNILRVAMQQDLPDFNTWNLASNGVWKANVINWGYETLAGLDMNLVPYPLLAESWTLDQSTAQPNVTIHLRHGVLFQDGTELTADDVVAIYTWARSGTTYSANIINAFDNNGDGQVSLAEIQQDVVKLDKYTVFMHMPKVYGQFFTSTLGVPIMPKHVWDAYLTSGGLIDVQKSNVNMTIGTGPMMYAGGVENSYRIMDRNPNYWGKNFSTPYMHKSIWPAGVDEIYFKIYASIDTAILALQSHAVDYISWAITPGRVTTLQSDPTIGLEYLSDNGYFYLAFNQKFEPMNNLSFRKACSYLIDKDQIVNLYMGGFGTKGAACEPPFWGVWQNQSVPTYSYDSTLATSKALLTAAGYVDVNGDGWREMPDGSPMPKITILTPPADYDPIRIRAGQMIALNLREAGINAEAKAIDFNTLVARLQSMDYQMLIIGWSLSTEPVGNVFDILGPKANSNTFGFWAADDPNPFYASLMGVNTLADSTTQAIARKVDQLGQQARGTFNVTDQIKYTLWGEGAIAQAIPVNVLYYRVNIEAYSKAWTGWTPYDGSLWASGANIFNLASLRKAGVVTTASAAVNLAVTLPGTVGVGKAVSGFVKTVDQYGNALAGAMVNVTTAGVAVASASTVQATPSSGTTDANGILSLSVTGSENGYSFVNVTATKGSVSATKSVTINSVTQYPPTLYVTVKPQKLVLRVGETTTVSLKVTDQNGLPVAGVNLTADKNLISYGSLDHLTVTSDSNGLASAVFSAPAALTQINAHEPTTLFYSATKAGYTFSTSPAVNMLIYNPAAPSWVMARVDSVSKTNLVVSPGVNHNVSSIKIQAVNETGKVLTLHKMTVSYSNESIVVAPVTTITTDGTGNATFTVQIKNGALTQGLRVTVKNTTTLMSVPATITLTYVDIAPAAPFYGGWMTLDTDPVATQSMYMKPLGSIKVTVHVFDENGAAADGINASVVLSGTAYGSLTGSDIINWDSTYDGIGINLVTSQDHANVVTSGPINTFYDYANWQEWYNNWVYFDWGMMTGVNITGGLMTFWVNGTDVAPLDLIGSIFIVPDGLGFFNSTTLGYEIDGPSLLTSEYVIGRSYDVVVPSFTVTKPEMIAKLAAPFDSSTVNVTVTDQNNAVVSGATVRVYEKASAGGSLTAADYGLTQPASTTDTNGFAQGTITANKKPSADVKADLYVRATMTGALSIFQQTQVYIYITHTFATIAPIEDAMAMGSQMIPVTAKVVDWAGNAVSNMPLELSTDVGAVVGDTVNMSTPAGEAFFNVSAPMTPNVRVQYMTLQVKAGAPTYDVSLGYLVLTIQNAGPQISAALQAAKGQGGMVFDKGSNVTLGGQVYDPLGVTTASYKLDTGTAVTVTGVSIGLGDNIRTLKADFGSALAVGSHSVLINATDSLGVSNSYTLSFEVKEHKAPSTIVPWSLAVVGWILFVVALVMMLMARRPKATPELGMPAEPEKPEEAPKT